MDERDDLRNLWCSQPETKGKDGEQMLTLVMERTRSLDRRIAVRNATEVLAALAVAAFFGWAAAAHRGGGIERLGLAAAAASGIWIACYVMRWGRGPRPLDRGLPLESYRDLLVENYDHQIRLLRTVKYWYLLPPYVALLITNIGTALRLTAEGKSLWLPLFNMVIITVIFAAVWFANEVLGVRQLKNLKREVLALDAVGDSR